MPERPVLVIEDDPFLRLAQILLDPDTDPERVAAFADFFAHEEPDFAGYCRSVRERLGGLFPAVVHLVDSVEELRAALPDACALVVEGFEVDHELLRLGPHLNVVQKFGNLPRNIDQEACRAAGIKVLTMRRRSNYACAEMAFALMLAFAKRLNRFVGRISPEQLAELGYPYRPFDRRHTPNSNWARIDGILVLFDTTIGIIGLGEIGVEVALRANAFGMRTLYYQRHRLSPAEEERLGARYVPLPTLLAESDWILPILPVTPSTRGLIGREELAQVKPGAIIVNVARPDAIERAALIEALRAGRLGGFALDPQYEAPGRRDDELLGFDNVILTPHLAAQPRANALGDLAELCEQLARALGYGVVAGSDS